jgi:hypothetical protein
LGVVDVAQRGARLVLAQARVQVHAQARAHAGQQLVMLADVADDELHGPAVRDDVVHHHRQHEVLRAELVDDGAQQ